MPKIINAIIVICLNLPIAAGATGWHDYELNIGSGYSILRASSVDVSLLRNHQFLISQEQYNNIGPIINYSDAQGYFYIKIAGLKKRNLFSGDTFIEADLSKVYYFIVRKQDGLVDGPLLEESFVRHPNVLQMGSYEWLTPKNPNFWRPILGDLFFLSLALPILYAKYWYIAVPLSMIGILWVFKKKRKKGITSTPPRDA